ncbi:hypothetical protein QA596_01850 [Balneolales bacterium ANBcel1]|nr:hypothetical protein [Balneolales bacterium ANBcel1]
MRTKLILIAVLLAGMVVLANWLTGRYLASIVDGHLQHLADANEQAALDYGSLRINPALGSLTLHNLAFRNEHGLLQSEKIRGSLPYADIWRALRHGGSSPEEQIRSFQLNIENLSYRSAGSNEAGRDTTGETAGSTNTSAALKIETTPLTVDFASIVYNGHLEELFTLFATNTPPRWNHRITLNFRRIDSDGTLPAEALFLSALSGYHLPQEIDRFGLQIRYLAGERSANITNFRIAAPKFSFHGVGDFSYTDNGWPDAPASFSTRYELSAVTQDLARIPLSETLGGFSMDSLSISSSVTVDDGDAVTGRHPLVLPGETSFRMSGLYWYPSEVLTDRYGMLLGMVGITDQRLPVRALSADYRNYRDTLFVDEAMLMTDPFDALLQAIVATPDDGRPDVTLGSVTFVRTSAAFNDFIDGIEGLFLIELPRRDGRLHLEFSGDPRAPDFDLELPG